MWCRENKNGSEGMCLQAHNVAPPLPSLVVEKTKPKWYKHVQGSGPCVVKSFKI